MKIHILCSVTFFRKSHRLWDNIEKYSGDWGATNCHNMVHTHCMLHWQCCTHPHVRVPMCMHAHTCNHAHTDQYVILIAFPQWQWFLVCASVLSYTYIACLVWTTSFVDLVIVLLLWKENNISESWFVCMPRWKGGQALTHRLKVAISNGFCGTGGTVEKQKKDKAGWLVLGPGFKLGTSIIRRVPTAAPYNLVQITYYYSLQQQVSPVSSPPAWNVCDSMEKFMKLTW
jgi:hypothetical protein